MMHAVQVSVCVCERQIHRQRIWIWVRQCWQSHTAAKAEWKSYSLQHGWMYTVHASTQASFPPLPTSSLIPRPSWGPASLPPASSAPWAAAPPGHGWQSLWCAASRSQPRQLSGPAAWPPPLRSGPFQPAGLPSAPNAAGEEREGEGGGRTNVRRGKGKRKVEDGRGDGEMEQRKRDGKYVQRMRGGKGEERWRGDVHEYRRSEGDW